MKGAGAVGWHYVLAFFPTLFPMQTRDRLLLLLLIYLALVWALGMVSSLAGLPRETQELVRTGADELAAELLVPGGVSPGRAAKEHAGAGGLASNKYINRTLNVSGARTLLSHSALVILRRRLLGVVSLLAACLEKHRS